MGPDTNAAHNRRFDAGLPLREAVTDSRVDARPTRGPRPAPRAPHRQHTGTRRSLGRGAAAGEMGGESPEAPAGQRTQPCRQAEGEARVCRDRLCVCLCGAGPSGMGRGVPLGTSEWDGSNTGRGRWRITGMAVLMGKRNGFVTPTETNVHGDALCFTVKAWARHKTAHNSIE